MLCIDFGGQLVQQFYEPWLVNFCTFETCFKLPISPCLYSFHFTKEHDNASSYLSSVAPMAVHIMSSICIILIVIYCTFNDVLKFTSHGS